MKTILVSAAAGALVGLGLAAAASAAAPQQQQQQTPKGWSWTYDKHGNRVQKGTVTKTSDGSREEIRDGKCVTVKEVAQGVYKESIHCKPR